MCIFILVSKYVFDHVTALELAAVVVERVVQAVTVENASGFNHFDEAIFFFDDFSGRFIQVI